MAERIKIVEVDRVDGYGVIVDFSDSTTARYTVEELINMRPLREQSQDAPLPSGWLQSKL